jgi:hypothetical protein
MNLAEEPKEESTMEYTVMAWLPNYGLFIDTFKKKEDAIWAAGEINRVVAEYWAEQARSQ